MKITKISVYQVTLPFNLGDYEYKLSGGRTWSSLDNTIIRLDTDEGVVGWGETCPFGPNYVEAFALGARAGIEELAPSLLGQDPSQPRVVYETMDFNMLGHPYVKHGIDLACWDILGKVSNVPLDALLGGRLNERVQTSGWIPTAHGALMDKRLAENRTNKCPQFSTKLSGDPTVDIPFLKELGAKMLPGESVKVDANAGWRVDEAIRIMRAVEQVDVYFEQPCATYEECRAVVQACGRPIVFDEMALDMPMIIRGWDDGICHAVNIKLGRLGGITPSLEIRNLCASLGIPFYVQCAGGNNITQAAIVHMAQSSPANRLLWVWDIGDLISFETCADPIRDAGGYMQTGDAPGLGVEPIMDVLGEPVAVYE